MRVGQKLFRKKIESRANAVFQGDENAAFAERKMD
jgi:hypothetical protein